MKTVEALVNRWRGKKEIPILEPEPVFVPWTLEQTVENLTLLQASNIDNSRVLKNNSPSHVHYFPSLRKDPYSLFDTTKRLLAESKDDGSFLGPNGFKIMNLYQRYLESEGFDISQLGVAPPEPGFEYSSPFHIAIPPGDNKWDPQKTVEHFDWIDYSVGVSRVFMGRFVAINTTRRQGSSYTIDMPKLDNLKRDLQDSAKQQEIRTDFLLKPTDQSLITDLLAART